MADIHHEIRIQAPPEKVLEALTTAKGLMGWYSAYVQGEGTPGHTWRFEFAQRPTFCWEVLESHSPMTVAWRCIVGPNDSVGTRVTVQLSPADRERTFVECSHTGWPGTEGNFRKCNTYWGVLLYHLKQYCETGTPCPAFT